ncbi:hypothetical protein K8W59_06120 [Nocardioides rotundus]|uniref:hypothetical protein n=1 Tax=Nocardioides rotundus TaxID=1774216 RepID=UPI001CBC41A6|nr:hypothetical protein [Nocardioides rotundus]UAL31059.1 hypothetical protein K8W59_06120 [Nocardioides rotundus]
MADSSHKRDTDARLLSRIPRSALVAAPIATVATLGVVSAGVIAGLPGGSGAASTHLAGSSLSASVGSDAVADRERTVSRSAPRDLQVVDSGPKLAINKERLRRIAERKAAKATAAAVAGADTRLWTTADLNIWTAPAGGTDLGLLQDTKRVLVTGRKASGRTEVVLDGKSRWVTSGYLSDDKPQPETESASSGGGGGSSTPSLGGSCTNGTSVSGSPNILKVHEAVCASFPSITTYGTYRGDGEHSQGLAIDIMVSGSTGWQVAEFVRANAAALGVNYVMYSQRIWSVQRSSEGWRTFADRGSVTQNHYDHVHVTTY